MQRKDYDQNLIYHARRVSKPATPSCLILIGLCLAVVSSLAQTPPATKPSVPDAGEISEGFYRNAFFGFKYRVPYAWVDRTQEMKDDSASAAKSKVLLGIFEHPPEATTSSINSAVVIAVESASAYPGLKHAAQYFGPLGEVTTANGLSPINEPYDFPVDGRPIVRRDFVKKMGVIAMHQSTLAWLSQGFVVSFTFIGSSEEEVQSLIEPLAISKVKTPPRK